MTVITVRVCVVTEWSAPNRRGNLPKVLCGEQRDPSGEVPPKGDPTESGGEQRNTSVCPTPRTGNGCFCYSLTVTNSLSLKVRVTTIIFTMWKAVSQICIFLYINVLFCEEVHANVLQNAPWVLDGALTMVNKLSLEGWTLLTVTDCHLGYVTKVGELATQHYANKSYTCICFFHYLLGLSS